MQPTDRPFDVALKLIDRTAGYLGQGRRDLGHGPVAITQIQNGSSAQTRADADRGLLTDRRRPGRTAVQQLFS